jgi:hypothetical protein
VHVEDLENTQEGDEVRLMPCYFMLCMLWYVISCIFYLQVSIVLQGSAMTSVAEPVGGGGSGVGGRGGGRSEERPKFCVACGNTSHLECNAT